MSRKDLILAALLAVAAAAPAAAQRAASVELDGFGTWTKFDKSLQFKDRFGAGGLLGIFIAKNIALEGDASYTQTHFDTGLPGDFSYIPIRARLAAHLPLGSSYSRLILGAGYVSALYRKDLHERDNGLTGLVGLKLGLSRHFALRADGIIDYVPSPFNGAGSNVHYSARAGVSILFGSYPPNQDSIRADSVQRAERARTESIRRAEAARADSVQRAAQARADSIQQVERARTDSIGQAAVQDSLRAAQQAQEDSVRLAREAGQVDSIQIQLMLERKKNLVLTGVTFDFNKSRLTLDARKVLDFVAQSVKAHPEAKIEVGGYTDSVGSAAYNQRLSLARARAVRIYLIEQGVPADQLTAVGYGESSPVASNTTEEGRAQNRRVELRRPS
jgi:outer membrane protein OmpA-like peptidoglycan-associated protein/opacity protein-like surface antigen